MKKLTLTTLALALVVSAFGQGQVQFNNRVVGTQVSPIFGVNSANPTLNRAGQPANGTPAGTTDYTGSPALLGTGFSAALFGGVAGTSDANLTFLSQTAFRTSTSLAGFVQPPANPPAVPGVPENQRAQLQIRVWDNLGGTVTTWEQAFTRWQQGGLAAGMGNSFLSEPLGGTLVTPPALTGMTSFNIYMVPEPSTIALGILGGLGTLVLIRRRK